MKHDQIDEDELLYRSVPNIDGYWKEGRLSSATFSSSKGVSVDRGGGRTEAEIIEAFNNRFAPDTGIVAVTAKQCIDAGTLPVPRPTSDNPYHAEIHQSVEHVQLSHARRRRLAEICRVIRRPAMAREQQE